VLKRNDSDIELVKSVVLTCALQNLCERYGEDYQHEWDTAVAAEPVVPLAQGVEEEGRDICEGLNWFLNS